MGFADRFDLDEAEVFVGVGLEELSEFVVAVVAVEGDCGHGDSGV